MTTKRRNLILGIIAGILLLLAVATWLAIYWVMQLQPPVESVVMKTVKQTQEVTKKTEVVETPTEVARQIDGVLVEPNQAKIFPLALMIENAAFGGVRPQAGLSFAQVVYEIVVEGGITRFMAVYSGEMPDVIGPIRSSRPTFLEFSSEYDALHGHAGGSPEALQAISGLALNDLSALGTDSRFFYREGSKIAPHNLFTSSSLLTLARRDKGLDNATAEFDSWVFKDDAKSKIKPTTESSVTVDFGSGQLYIAKYVYDYKTNSYSRWTGGEEQIDAITGKPMQIKNVIVQVVPSAVSVDDEGRVNYNVTGEGKAYIARDGEVLEGVWKKADRQSRTLWYTIDGKEIELNRGATWIAILPETGTVEYTTK
ncbi:MAG: hypothetical protein ACD_21C00100G0003 [uncultured bacterium]|nr:MAG: hypothetical protein ACD_21C00100G0003 [uncultured bacterium]